MYSRWLEILRLSARYGMVAAIFAFWGGVAGILTVLAHWDETTVTILAVVFGGATAFPLWERFAPKRIEAEQTIWISPPGTARVVSIAATLLMTISATQAPLSQEASLAAQSLTTTAQNVVR